MADITLPELRDYWRQAVEGKTVEIGGVQFECDPPRTLYGRASQRPSASAAHAAVPYAYYIAVDTGDVTQTTGSAWRDVL